MSIWKNLKNLLIMSNNNIQVNDEQQGKKSSLWHLTSENAIVIPIIQRDYAQGRTNDDVRQIREPFLKKIFKVLGCNKNKLELDFIYGSLETPKDISLKRVDYENFVPLDGQQRLTTLFLLHWFLALWNKEDFELMQNHFRGRFSYTTRLSSSEFCFELLEHVCAKEVVDSINAPERKPISKFLKNEGWYHNQWDNDPTISGMLTMLDTMAVLFDDVAGFEERNVIANSFFKRLICENIDDTAITFNLLYLNRGDFHLSDELYIKMNSRGKPLSDFETFKARFETFLTKYTSEKGDFAGNIDGKWADVFWSMRNNVRPKSEEGKTVYYRDNTDGMMMNVIKIALANKYAILAENNDNGLDEVFETQVAKKANPDMHLTFYRYSELGVFNEISEKELSEEEKKIYSKNEDICLSVYNAFTFINSIKDPKDPDVVKYQVDEEFLNINELLNNILFYGIDGKNSKIQSISYQTRLLFWALSEYCIKYRNDILNCTEGKYIPLNRWMKFVRNMVESTEINDVNNMQKALKTLNSIFTSMKDGDIVMYLSQLKKAPDCTPFPPSQIKEEILKAQLISIDNKWEELIIKSDNVNSWPGRSGYLLYFSGLSDKSYEEMHQWDAESHNCYQNLYNTYKQKMDMLLSYLNYVDYRTDCLFERALLTKGYYLRKEDNKSIIYSMMDQSVKSRSYSFRQMIQFNGIDSDDDNSTYKEGVECLKAILDDTLYVYSDTQKVEDSLKNIISQSLNCINDWRWPLIKCPKIWHEAVQRFMWIDKNDKNGTAWVVRQKGGGTNQYETWSYYLYLKLQDNGVEFSYYPHRYPRFTLLTFRANEQMYQLKISHISTGEWKFEMVAIDENYELISLTIDMRKFIFNLMPSNSSSFIKKSIHDTIIWAKAMHQSIESNAEILTK